MSIQRQKCAHMLGLSNLFIVRIDDVAYTEIHVEKMDSGLSPQIINLYRINSKAAIRLTFDSHCQVIAALFFIPYHCLILADKEML